VYSLIDESDVVLFDVFDTAVFRKVSQPSEVFNLLGTGFKFKRMQAEHAAATKNPNIDDIYDEIPELSHLKQKEIDLELALTYQNPEIHSLYQYALKQGKKVGFASDMYLPLEVIQKILNKSGYVEMDFLYVSSEVLAKKETGEMYSNISRMLYYLNLGTDKALMIGDNKHSDYDMAIKSGFKAVHYRKTFSEHDFWYRLGYNDLGCITLAFVSWLRNRFREQGVETAYFLSREGLIFKKVYDLIRDYSDPNSEYLYVSRKTTHLAVVANLEWDDFFNNPNNEFIYWFIRNQLCKNERDFLNYLGLYDMAASNDLDYSKLSSHKREHCQDKLLKKVYFYFREECSKFRQRILYYLARKINYCSKIAIVDIGWQGSIQKALKILLDDFTTMPEMFGYYFATSMGADKNKEILNLESFLDKDCVCLSNVWLIENLFTCGEGSLVDYDELNPVMDGERKPYVEWIHNGILDFVEDFKNMIIDNPANLGKIKFSRLLTSPSLEEANMLGEIKNYSGSDDFGVYIAKPDLSDLIRQYNKSSNKNIFRLRLLDMINAEF
jgi:predicted HAD superfamily hydrolase